MIVMRKDHLDWPFFDAAHRSLGAEAIQWAATRATAEHLPRDVDAACRGLVSDLGAAGLLRHCVPARFGGASEEIDSRSICLLRQTLAYHDGLADFAFAMQGLGSGALALAGADGAVAARWLPRVARGEAIAAYQKVLAVEPDNANVHASLGMAFDRLGRHDQARRQMELALQLDPGQREARDYFNHQFGRDARGGPTAFTAR